LGGVVFTTDSRFSYSHFQMESSSSIYSLRYYQQLIATQALHSNVIAFLPTGLGKTYIAFHVIDCKLQEIRRSIDDNHLKFIVFIAPTKALLNQQIVSIQRFCKARADTFNGERRYNSQLIDAWGAKEWLESIRGLEVLGMTPAIFRNLLEKSILPENAISLIILDECHHAAGNHEMGRLCDALKNNPYQKPLILGLTASPIKVKTKGFEKVINAITDLEERTNCTFYLPTKEMIDDLYSFHIENTTYLMTFDSSSESCLRTIMTNQLLLHLQGIKSTQFMLWALRGLGFLITKKLAFMK
jgi:ERCC4-related helicase